MKKDKIQSIKEALATTAPIEQSQEIGSDPGLASNLIWFGRDAVRHIMEKAEDAYYGYFSEDPDDEPHPGLRQMEEFLGELQSVTGLRLRLIFGPPEMPLHELDISKLESCQGGFETDEIQRWIAAGAALIADTADQI